MAEPVTQGPPVVLTADAVLPIVGAQTVAELAQAVVAAAELRLEFRHTGFYFLNPDTYRLELVLAKNFPESDRIAAEQSMERRHPGWVMRHRKSIYVPDASADPLTTQNPAASVAEIRTRYYVPLVSGGQCLGTLGLASLEVDAFGPDERAYFDAICQIASVTYGRMMDAAQLLKRRRQMELAISAAEEGLWEWDIPSGVVQFSDKWMTMLGFAPNELPHREETFFQLVHPDDAELVSAAIRAHFHERVPYAVEFRMRRKDGSHAWVLARGQVVRNASGEPQTMSGTHVDLTAKRAAETAMREARDAAVEASRLKSQFVANMSHEVRTPMNGIIGLSHLLSQTQLDGKQREYVELIHHSAEALLGVLNDVLDFSKIESGRLQVDLTRVDLATVVRQAAATTSGIAASKRLRVELELGEQPVLVLADDLRVRQVLLNLLGNAIKFTEQGGVTIRAVAREAMIRLEVVDTGIGIAPDLAVSMFLPFRQADGSLSRRAGGSGLGLAISKQLVALMGGAIGYEPTAGGGSCFWVELPRFQEQDAAPTYRHVAVLDNDTIESRVLMAVFKRSSIQVLETLESLATLDPLPDLLVVSGQLVTPERLREVVAPLLADGAGIKVVVRTRQGSAADAFAAAGFPHVIRTSRDLAGPG